MTYSADALISKYIEIRDHKAALAEKHKLEMAPLNEGLTVIEAALMDLLNAQGGQNIKTGSGTAYRTEILNVKVESWDDFFACAMQNPDMLVKNANKTAVKEYMEANDGQTPPGISTSTIFNLNVRRT